MKTETILLDAHIHTSGISLCSQLAPNELIEASYNDHVDAIVLTNHYKLPHVRGSFNEWIKRYIDEFRLTKQIGENYGMKVFFGLEVTLTCMPQNDFTIYGVSEDAVLEEAPLYNLSLPELSAFAHRNHALIYHAHPFRNTVPVDPQWIDGVEINCHLLYKSPEEKKVREYADKYQLRLSCGSDYHGDCDKPHCGIYIPKSIKTEIELTQFLRDNPRPELEICPDPV